MKSQNQYTTNHLNTIRFLLTLSLIAVLLCNINPVTKAHEAPPDENLDFTFGNGGKVVTDFAGSTDVGFAMVIQPDGKIIVGGQAGIAPSVTDYGLVRYNIDGSLDSSFGTGGKVSTDVGGLGDTISAIALQPDGKIVAAGFSFTAHIFDFSVVRYNSNGTLDTSFGNGGKVLTDLQNNDDEALAMVIQPDGKIVLAGFTADSNFDLDFAMVRYQANGSLDTSFGNDGKVITDFDGSDDQGFSLIRQPDGKLIAGGFAIDPKTSESNFALVRYNADGSIDESFGEGGKTTTEFDEASGISSMFLLPDGKFLAAGFAFTAHDDDERPTHGSVTGDFALARYNSDGSLDETFGEKGKVTTDFFGENDAINSIALQADGKIIAAGAAVTGHRDEDRTPGLTRLSKLQKINRITDGDLDPSTFALARYFADGTLDTSFGEDGKVSAEVAHDVNIAFSVAIQSDGRIVTAGWAGTFERPDFGLARFLPTGFDICLQDETNGNILRLNSITGDYQFQNCSKGLRMVGKGAVSVSGCKITLTDVGTNPKKPDRNVQVSVNPCVKTGAATVVISSPASRSEINDLNITNNTCMCR